MRRSRSSFGFTAIEVILVTSILAIMAAFAVFSLTAFRETQDLNSAQDIILSKLEAARTHTVASRGAQQFGMHFETNAVVLFPGSSYAAGNSANETFSLPPTVELVNTSLIGWPDVVFSRLTGIASGTGAIMIRITNDPAQSRTIRLTEYGQATGPFSYAPQLGARVTDTRHVHYVLGWSIQDAVTLRFTFTRADMSLQVEDVVMAPYFSGGPPPAAFSWGGSFTVDGAAQALRVYTHALGVSDTNLSVNRDRMLNTKAVKITIISPTLGTRDIVSYAANGTITVEPFGGTATVQ